MDPKDLPGGGPAFPVSTGDCLQGHQNGHTTWQFPGMTLRDHFAGLAMQGFMSGHIAHHGHESHWPYGNVASEAYDVADAMLKARGA